MSTAPASKRMVKTLPARMILSMLAVTITFGTLLVLSVLYLTAQTYKDQFVNGTRERALVLSKAIEKNPSSEHVEVLLEDALLSPNLVFAEYVPAGRNQRKISLGSIQPSPGGFTEDYFFGNSPDEVYYVATKISGADPLASGQLRLGFHEGMVNAQLKHITQRSLVFALVYLWAILLLSASIALRMTKPLRLLQQGAREIAQGHTDFELKVSTSVLEVAALAGDLERMRQELVARSDKLAASEARYSAIVYYAADAIFTLNQDRNIENVNLAAETLFGYSSQQLLNAPFTDLLADPTLLPAFMDPDWSDKCKNAVFMGRRKDGTTFPLALASSSFQSVDVTLRTLVVHDMSDRVAFEQVMTDLAFYDTLTHLPNRRLFLDRLSQSLAQARRNRKLLAVFFLDLDGFKVVNDTYGHQAGDDLLIAVGERLSAILRQSDTVARLGGDEFTIILSNLQDADDARSVVHKVISAFDQPFSIKGHELSISTSVGISVFPIDDSAPEKMIEHADAAMYYAKKSGKNCYRFYVASMFMKAAERHERVNQSKRNNAVQSMRRCEESVQPKVTKSPIN